MLITYRKDKTVPLTADEVDANFSGIEASISNLDASKVSVSEFNSHKEEVSNELGEKTTSIDDLNNDVANVKNKLDSFFTPISQLHGASEDVNALPFIMSLPYFDTDLHKPVWFDGTDWYDAMGNLMYQDANA